MSTDGLLIGSMAGIVSIFNRINGLNGKAAITTFVTSAILVGYVEAYYLLHFEEKLTYILAFITGLTGVEVVKGIINNANGFLLLAFEYLKGVLKNFIATKTDKNDNTDD